MGKYLFAVLLLACSFVLHAQINLVPNPSFEQYVSCPNNTGQVDSCVGWYSVLETPDYYNTCAPYPVNIPNNVCGYQNSFDGFGYMGLHTFTWIPVNYREIIGAALIDTIVVGNTYNISMRVSRGNWTIQAYNCSASNKLGILFTTNPITKLTISDINNFASVYTDSIITDTLNWVMLSWSFVADSAYTGLYIGNFFDDNNTDTLVIAAPLGQFGYAYYYIDSINVYCTSGNCNVGVKDITTNHISVFYNNTSNELNVIFENNSEFKVSIINTLGQICKTVSISITQKFTLPKLSQGIYYAVLQSAKNTVVKKFTIH
ncbi:MAG TPA: T9SS type A sorting domain-containing protein [Bacteroidia bacterium]|nr:T9SS type A sorting domain-containing protein [Bacteroidia bacterium]